MSKERPFRDNPMAKELRRPGGRNRKCVVMRKKGRASYRRKPRTLKRNKG